MQSSLSTPVFAPSSSTAAVVYSATNQSPEDVTALAPVVKPNYEKVVPINSGVESLHDMARQLVDVKAALQATQAQLQEMKEVEAQTHRQMVEWMAEFERSHSAAQIKQAQVTRAQNLQLERRLQRFVQNLVKGLMHSAVQRFVRPRSSAIPEPATQPSTYIVPERKSTGIYS